MKYDVAIVSNVRGPRMLRVSRLAVAVGILPLALALVVSLGCNREPFKYVKVSGKVTYEDGSVIPADPLELTFYPEAAPIDPKTHPRPGKTTANKETGEFSIVTSHKYNDGLTRGKHKVTLGTLNSARLPPSVVGVEYSDQGKTPLEVDTDKQPFELKVKKPEKKK